MVYHPLCDFIYGFAINSPALLFQAFQLLRSGFAQQHFANVLIADTAVLFKQTRETAIGLRILFLKLMEIILDGL